MFDTDGKSKEELYTEAKDILNMVSTQYTRYIVHTRLASAVYREPICTSVIRKISSQEELDYATACIKLHRFSGFCGAMDIQDMGFSL